MGKASKNTSRKAAVDRNRSMQLNPNNARFWKARRLGGRPERWGQIVALFPQLRCEYSQAELDNHSNQLNPNNDACWTSRGEEARPEDWEEQIEEK